MTQQKWTRREFTQTVGFGLAAAFASPIAARGWEERLAHLERVKLRPKDPTDLVLLNSNENPYGPAPVALAAMVKAHGIAGRYPDYVADQVQEALARLHSVQPEMVQLTCGSTEMLKVATQAFLGPGKRLVMADPTFEAPEGYARLTGAEVVKVPVDANYRLDLEAMAKAASVRAGLVYVCNPNNPTGTFVSQPALAAFLERVPAESVVLVDEAYYHYVEHPDYATALDFVHAGRNVIVTRTFSKVYGMAGLRLGYGVARADLIRQMRPHQVFESWNVMACAAALASLEDPDVVERNRRLNSAARAYLVGEMERRGYAVIPSETNFVMIHLHREVTPIIEAFYRAGIAVGRLFRGLPEHLRVSIGTQAELEKFVAAFDSVLEQMTRAA